MSDPLLLNLFIDLIKISSPSSHEEMITNYVLQFLKNHHISAHQDKYGNVLAFLPGNTPPRLFSAHLDTVDPCQNIIPVIQDGIIKSSGNSILGADNKAALSAILYALITLPKSHPGLEIVFTRSEEVGNLGAVNLDYSQLKSKIGFSFDFGGDLGQIFTSSPYYLRFDITITGIASHASTPAKAQNVLPQVARLISSLPLGSPYPDTTLNIGLLSAGTARNTIPGNASLSGEIRSFSMANLSQLETFIKSQLPDHTKYSSFLENPGFVLSPDDPAVKMCESAITRTKLHPKLTNTYACFDANIFISHGINMVNMSDGSANNHTTDESISIENLESLSKIAMNLMTSPF